jgi:hypothetical protein
LHQAQAIQLAQGLAHHAAADAQFGAQFTLGGQHVACFVLAGKYPLLQIINDMRHAIRRIFRGRGLLTIACSIRHESTSRVVRERFSGSSDL